MADTSSSGIKMPNTDYSSIGDFIPSLQENGKIRRPAKSPRQTVSQSGSRNTLNIDKEDYRKLKDEFHPDEI